MLERLWTIADGLDHPEGVAVGPDGTLYAGGEDGQVYQVGADGALEVVARTGGFVLGLAVDAADRVYACDLGRGAVLRVDVTSGDVAVHSAGTADAPMRSPNHPAFDAHGNLYVTDSGAFDASDGVIYRIAPDGTTVVWSREPAGFPNGCCLSHADDALLVVTSTPDPGVARVPIRHDGSAGPAEVLLELPGTVPDGIAPTADGGLLVSCYRPDRIYRVTPAGEASVLADDPRGTTLSAPTNVAFAGPEHDRLIVASLGRWHLTAGDLGIVGRRLHHPQV